MRLVIAEKPSVAQSIARVLGAKKREDGYVEGNGYLVSWCVGHLVELAEPDAYDPRYKKWAKEDLPLLPAEWKYSVSAATKKQFDILKQLMNQKDVEEIICATDAGREGELIFRLVYHQCGCKKPFLRLWISSMEDSAIRDGFANLRPGTEYDALYEAALCRERADWIVGMNATRLFSVLYGRTLHVGRVASPTLAMAVLREAEIAAFQPETFYSVHLTLPGNMTVASGRIKEKTAAEALALSCTGGAAVVTKCERKEKSEKAPALYDLTSLQRDANRLLGFTAQQTLDYTQSLYEKKLVTYPRTDSRYLTDDMEEKVPALAGIAAKLTGKAVPEKIMVKPVINSKKVSDHHAIIPTMSAAQADLPALPVGEREILRLIATRLLAAVAQPYRYAETAAEFLCGEEIFTVKGKTVLDAGWKVIEKPEKAEKAETPLPEMKAGDSFSVLSTEIKEGQTKPKAHYTEDTLLSAMERAGADDKVNCPTGARDGGLGRMPDEVERKGIGTPATRAGIIERLVTRGFLERKGDKKAKNLIPTEKGTALITVLPEQLQSASMTADWEEKLLQIEHGEYSPDAFMTEIEAMVSDLVDNYQVVKEAAVIMPDTRKSLGKCPVCGADVVERPKSWSCSDRSCNFALWKNNRYFEAIGKHMNESVAKKLLKNGSVHLKGCYSKRLDKYFEATIFLDFDETGKVQYRMEKGR
ncbi:MAG: DNA topoisomerase 3 [Clostridiales bacterium]|nr:DNA topoisomerase 3 [Clostridiales bacterium]